MEKVNFSKYLKISLSALILLALLLGFSGQSDLFFSSSKDIVAKVGNTKITNAELNAMVENEIMQIKQQNGPMEISEEQKKSLRKAMLNSAIDEKLMGKAVKDMHLLISDDVIAKEIKKVPFFTNQETGLFDKDRFAEMLKQMGKNEYEYIQEMKVNLGMYGLFVAMNKAPIDLKIRNDIMINQLYRSRIVDLVKVSTIDNKELKQISDEDIQEYYDDHKKEFVNSEYRAINYFLLNADNFRKQIKIEDSELNERIEETLKAMPKQETRSFYNIIFNNKEDADKAHDYLIKLNKIEDIQGIFDKDLKIKAHIMKLIDKRITDLPNEFQDLIFNQLDNTHLVSDITQNMQIIVLSNIKQITNKDLEEKIRKDMTEELVNQKLSDEAAKIHQAQASIEDLVKTYNATIKHFDYFDNDGYYKDNTSRSITEDYLLGRDVLDEIFKLQNEEVKINGNMSDYIIYSLDSKKPTIQESPKSLELVKDFIVEKITEQRDAEHIKKIAFDIFEDLKINADLEGIIKKYSDKSIEVKVQKNVEIMNPELIKMMGGNNILELSDKIFSLSEKEKITSPLLFDNENVIAIVTGWKNHPILESERGQLLEIIQSNVYNAENNEIMQTMMDELKKKYTVKIYLKD